MKNEFFGFSSRMKVLFSAMMVAVLAAGSPQLVYAGNDGIKSVLQTGVVKGQVVDATGESVIGATVTIKGTTIGVITDLDGNFSIEDAVGKTLVISYVGYKTQEITVTDTTPLNVVLKDDAEMLEEVVVVGYGTQKKATLTGSIAVVDSKTFEEKGPMSSPLQALQGQVPGTFITRSSSAPGDESWGISMGTVSANSTSPLFIVDGVTYSQSSNDLRHINSNDIESISFLKDGAAAIYGSRAAGGVVLITTKKGAAGKTRVEYNATATYSIVGLMPTLMNIDQWADGVMTALTNDGNEDNVWYQYASAAKAYKNSYIDVLNGVSGFPFGSSFTDVEDFVFDDSVNWLNTLFDNCWSTEHNLSISGGSDAMSYRLSLGYLYSNSTLQFGNNDNSRYTFRLNNTFKLGKNVSVDSSISYTRQEQVAPQQISSVLTTSVPMPGLPFFSKNGNYYGWGTWASPIGQLEAGGDNELSVSTFGVNEALNWKMNDWLSMNVQVGYNTNTATRDQVYSSVDYYNYAGDTVVLTTPSAESSYYASTYAKTDFYSFSGYLNAQKNFGKHNFKLMAGAQYEFTDYKYWGARVLNTQSDLDIINGSGDVSLNGSEDKYQFSTLSYYGRFNYDYDGRYLLDANVRYDGSSKFLSENRWDIFWGVSLGWRINQEAFLKDVDWLSDLKLRVSYAEIGNQSGIGNYDGVQLYSINSESGAYVGDALLSTITTSGTLASTTRTWERIKNWNFGLDFGFLNNRLVGSLNYYRKNNDNMLISVTYPGTLGISAPKSNDGKFEAYGYDGQITWRDKIGEVSYHVGGTFSFARNKLVYYGSTTVLSSGYSSTREGYPLNSLFGLRYGGKIQNEDQLAAYLKKYYENNAIGMPSNLRVGDNMFCDENGDGVLDENDYVYLGPDTPEISYSFNFGASWKGLDVSVIFQGVANRTVYRGIDNYTVPFRANYTNTTDDSVGKVWSTDNPNAYYAPYTNDSNINNYNYQASSLTALDGRYLRLKNVTVGYTFPDAWLKKTKVISAARIYVSGADLWETTKIHDGWDPEASRSASGTGRYPFTRNITFGANITF